MWGWAYGTSRQERLKYDIVFNEMKDFANNAFANIDMSAWAITLKVPLFLARSNAEIAFMLGYYMNQILINVFPKITALRR